MTEKKAKTAAMTAVDRAAPLQRVLTTLPQDATQHATVAVAIDLLSDILAAANGRAASIANGCFRGTETAWRLVWIQ
jgi:hypothetical protein